jgi:hypothetical protein
MPVRHSPLARSRTAAGPAPVVRGRWPVWPSRRSRRRSRPRHGVNPSTGSPWAGRTQRTAPGPESR